MYANKIQLFIHNFTNLPKALVRMWVNFLSIDDSFVVKYTAGLINFEFVINCNQVDTKCNKPKGWLKRILKKISEAVSSIQLYMFVSDLLKNELLADQ